MRKKRHVFFKIIICLLVIGLMILLVSNRVLVTKHEDLYFENLPTSFDGYKIVQLSDLHSNTYGQNNSRLLKKVDKENPDIVVLTGDMVNSFDTELDTFYFLAEALARKYDVYYIVGNHEQALQNVSLESLYAHLKSLGITVLDNEKAIIKKGNDSIQLYGLWFNLRYYSDQTDELVKQSSKTHLDVDKVEELLGKKSEGFTLLLSHNPVYFDAYTQWGADLTLAGHMHGGLIRIPFKGGVFSPEKTYFPMYDAGLFEKDNQFMYVNRGLGEGTKGIRFWNCPEITSFTLYKK